jgi:hypothetical protein
VCVCVSVLAANQVCCATSLLPKGSTAICAWTRKEQEMIQAHTKLF